MKILIFGKIPPPIGGVTASIKNLICSLENKKHKCALFNFKNCFNQYDVGHIHYSNSLKRMLGVLVSKFFCKRTIFTIHGLNFNSNNMFNIISVFFVDGIIVLNNQIALSESKCSKKMCVLPNFYTEGFSIEDIKLNPILPRNTKKYALLYAYDNSVTGGEEVYGANFTLDAFKYLTEEFVLVFIDLSGAYKDRVQNLGYDIHYIESHVDFLSILQEVDVYLRPTSEDGNSIAIIESLSSGTPVVASDVVDRPETVCSYKYGDQSDFISKIKSVDLFGDTLELPSIDVYISYIKEL